MSIVDVVDVVTVWNGFVAAAGTVNVIVVFVRHVLVRHALIPVAVVFAMGVPVVDVVDVVTVRHCLVAAVGSVGVWVVVMFGACGSHVDFLRFERGRARRTRCG